MAQALAKIERAEHFLQHLANRHAVADSSSGKGIDIGLTDGNALAMAHAKIIVIRAETAYIRMTPSTDRKVARRARHDKNSNQSHRTDGCTQNQFIHRSLLKISVHIQESGIGGQNSQEGAADYAVI